MTQTYFLSVPSVKSHPKSLQYRAVYSENFSKGKTESGSGELVSFLGSLDP